jgi:hypothetical protein
MFDHDIRFSYAYVLALRNHASKELSLSELVAQCGNITPDEYQQTNHLFAIAPQMDITPFGTLTYGQCVRWMSTSHIILMVAMQSGHQCLLTGGMFNTTKNASHPLLPLQLLAAYYYVRGIPYARKCTNLSDEQSRIANLGTIPIDAPQNLTIVRAGPGTGKTTTAIELIRRAAASGKRILVVAFTNSAVSTIRRRICADPDLGYDFTHNAFSSKKSPTGTVLLSTVDMIAEYVRCTGLNSRSYGGRSVSFATLVADALLRLVNDPSVMPAFRMPDGVTPLFDHIVVDEAQMLSDAHMGIITTLAHNLTVSTINGSRTCHVTVFCDPRQAINSNAGKWLIRIHEPRHASTPAPNVPDSLKWNLAELTISFRFENPALLEFVMKISRRRPNIHVELRASKPLPPMHSAARSLPIARIDDIASEIAQVYASCGSVGLLTPTKGRTNAVSRQLAALTLALRKLRAPVSVQGESNFNGNGIIITTFNSAAGMEFKYVYILGMSQYPKAYQRIDAETGRALAFVANSRASHGICYLLDGPELGVDVDPQDVDAAPNTTTVEYALPDRYLPQLPINWTTEIMMDDNAKIYFENNGIQHEKFRVNTSYDQSQSCGAYEFLSCLPTPIPACVQKPGEMQVSPNVAILRGQIINGQALSGYSIVPPANPNDVREAYYWYTNRRIEPSRDPTGLWRRYMAILYAINNNPDATPTPTRCGPYAAKPWHDDTLEPYVIAPDLKVKLADRFYYTCVSENPYDTMYTCAVIWLKQKVAVGCLHVNPASGQITLYDNFQALYAYHLDAIRRLHVYAITSVFRAAYLSLPPPASHLHTVDTEYVDGSEIYEIAIVNVADPYRSFCAPIKMVTPGKVLLEEKIHKLGLTRDTYNQVASSISDFLLLFLESTTRTGITAPLLMYFSSKVDINWTEGCVATTDVANAIMPALIDAGTFNSSSRTSKLDAAYGAFVGPIDETGRHCAMPDTIALAELVRSQIT